MKGLFPHALQASCRGLCGSGAHPVFRGLCSDADSRGRGHDLARLPCSASLRLLKHSWYHCCRPGSWTRGSLGCRLAASASPISSSPSRWVLSPRPAALETVAVGGSRGGCRRMHVRGRGAQSATCPCACLHACQHQPISNPTCSPPPAHHAPPSRRTQIRSGRSSRASRAATVPARRSEPPATGHMLWRHVVEVEGPASSRGGRPLAVYHRLIVTTEPPPCRCRCRWRQQSADPATQGRHLLLAAARWICLANTMQHQSYRQNNKNGSENNSNGSDDVGGSVNACRHRTQSLQPRPQPLHACGGGEEGKEAEHARRASRRTVHTTGSTRACA